MNNPAIKNFFRRRKFFINKNIQLSLLIKSLLYVFFSLLLVAVFLFAPLMIELERSGYYSEKAVQVANQILYLHANFWPAVLLCLIAIGLHSIRTSHRFVGPLYRFCTVFRSIKEGYLPRPIYLRKGDYLLAEAEEINQMLEGLCAKITEIQGAQELLNEAISQCRDVAGHATGEEMTKRVNEVVKKGNELGNKVGYFKIAS